jgi:adhesin/invasin
VRGFTGFSGVRVNITTAAGVITLSAATDAASFGDFLASGGIGTLFGEGFTDQTLEAGTLPLPTTLGGVQVFVNGVPAALFFVSPTQINFQMPVAAGTGSLDIVVVNGAEVSDIVEAVVRTQVPGMFAFVASDGVATPVVTHADGSVVTPENPARPGEVLVGYLTGAEISPQPPDGVAAAADPLSLTVDPAEVTVGGEAATTLFSGATPGFVGLIQVNFQLAAALPPGTRLVLVIRFGGAETAPLSLPVEP